MIFWYFLRWSCNLTGDIPFSMLFWRQNSLGFQELLSTFSTWLVKQLRWGRRHQTPADPLSKAFRNFVRGQFFFENMLLFLRSWSWEPLCREFGCIFFVVIQIESVYKTPFMVRQFVGALGIEYRPEITQVSARQIQVHTVHIVIYIYGCFLK